FHTYNTPPEELQTKVPPSSRPLARTGTTTCAVSMAEPADQSDPDLRRKLLTSCFQSTEASSSESGEGPDSPVINWTSSTGCRASLTFPSVPKKNFCIRVPGSSSFGALIPTS